MRPSAATSPRCLNENTKRRPDQLDDLDGTDRSQVGEGDTMSSRRTTEARTPSVPGLEKLLEQYGCGPVTFTGTADALYERHLMFDGVVDPSAVGPRERYEAAARSVRDVL